MKDASWARLFSVEVRVQRVGGDPVDLRAEDGLFAAEPLAGVPVRDPVLVRGLLILLTYSIANSEYRYCAMYRAEC